jgi:hypothetical protein
MNSGPRSPVIPCAGNPPPARGWRMAGRPLVLPTRPAAVELIDDLTSRESKECPVSASLTDADRASLLRIKQETTKRPGG